MRIGITIFTTLLIGALGVGIVHANKPNSAPVPTITTSPSTLILNAPIQCVSVHSNIPYKLVDCDTLKLEGISPYLAKADARGHLVVKLHGDAVKAIVELGPVTLSLTGSYIDGKPFAAADTILVK